MRIKFDKIKIHHFLSFGDAEITLHDMGITLISGVNKCLTDDSLSNGSGKSSIWNAITFALTGETIKGVATNLANDKFNDGCYVDLTFYVNEDKYQVIRYKDDVKLGNDLKIFINDENKSGKGIKESKELLKQYLPDLTSQLIGSVIILGQGLPHKFSNNTPSGRKEVLEKLSKSDFMIEDIKSRLSKRDVELKTKMRSIEDTLLANNTKLNVYTGDLNKYKDKLSSYENSVDFEREITIKQNDLQSHINELSSLEKQSIEVLDKYDKLLQDSRDCLDSRDGAINEAKQLLEDNSKGYKELAQATQLEIKDLERQIKDINNIREFCPTCGQRLININKPSSKHLEEELSSKRVTFDRYSKDIDNLNECYNRRVIEINSKYEEYRQSLDKDINECKQQRQELSTRTKLLNDEKNNLTIEITSLESKRDNYNKEYNELQLNVKTTSSLIEQLEKDNVLLNSDKMTLDKHIEVLKNINTLVKRDFRGFLLTNVIDFINRKAKEYCECVFHTDLFNMQLNGNNIDITYCNKAYENLSGGEAQKVDLILQFAIRDMLCRYLDFSSNILVLDEIFDNLDAKGSSNILNLISTKLVDIESIFIITHHSFDLAIPNDKEITIVKDEKGISSVK